MNRKSETYKTTISLPKKGRKEKKKSNERINVSNFQLQIGSYKLLDEKKVLYKFKKPDKPKPNRINSERPTPTTSWLNC